MGVIAPTHPFATEDVDHYVVVVHVVVVVLALAIQIARCVKNLVVKPMALIRARLVVCVLTVHHAIGDTAQADQILLVVIQQEDILADAQVAKTTIKYRATILVVVVWVQ